MSSTFHQPVEEMLKLLAHAKQLNERLRAAKVPMGAAVTWLNENIPDWKTSVGGKVKISKTRFGYEMAYAMLDDTSSHFGRSRGEAIKKRP